jgi:hypothetical protein
MHKFANQVGFTRLQRFSLRVNAQEISEASKGGGEGGIEFKNDRD